MKNLLLSELARKANAAKLDSDIGKKMYLDRKVKFSRADRVAAKANKARGYNIPKDKTE